MRSWFVVLLLVGLAGCSNPPADPAPVEAGPSVITAPGESLNDTGAHIHDYWRGGDRLTIIDASHPGGDQPGTGPGYANGQDIEVRKFLPESGSVVPQGTSALEVTFTWTPDELDSWTAPKLYVRTAAQDEATEIGAVESGEPLLFNITADDADLPHQVLSAFEFQLRMSSPDPMPLRFKGAVQLTVDAIRGLPLPVFPAHPDPWKGQNELPLLDVAGSLSYFEDVRDGGCNGADCPTAHRPPPLQLVPHNASFVRVVLDWTSPAAPIHLRYHSGLSRDFESPAPTETAAGHLVYELEVAGGGDGPYAKQSQWEFQVVPQPTGPLTTAWMAEYSLTATVLR